MSTLVFRLTLQASVSLVSVRHPLQIWLLLGQLQGWVWVCKVGRQMQICHVYIGTILVGHLGRGRTTYPFPGNILTTLCTFICPNMGNPREIQWGWYTSRWLVYSQIQSCRSPALLRIAGRLTMKSGFPMLSCQLACAWVWPRGGSDSKLEGGQRGKARRLLPILDLGDICSSGNVSSLVCAGPRFCED